MGHRAVRTVTVLICAVGLSAGAAACSSTPKSSATTSSVPDNPTTSGSTTAGSSSVSQPTNPDLNVLNEPAARKDISDTSCSDTGAGWVMKGLVTNTTAANATYVIEVTFTNVHYTIQGIEKTTVNLSSGKATSWSTTWPSSVKTGITCVLEAVERT